MPRSALRTLLLLLPAVLTGPAHPASSADTPGPDSAIREEGFDATLLRQMIFEATNRVRRERGLKEFEPSPEADEAAGIQARLGSIPDRSSHTNPFITVATLPDRANWVGLKAAGLGENVARTPRFNIGGGTQFEVSREDGRRVYRNLETGRELEPHTYASFAADVVARWMESPGHRANIVNPRFRLLGLGVHLARSTSGADMISSVQVFIVPEKRR